MEFSCKDCRNEDDSRQIRARAMKGVLPAEERDAINNHVGKCTSPACVRLKKSLELIATAIIRPGEASP